MRNLEFHSLDADATRSDLSELRRPKRTRGMSRASLTEPSGFLGKLVKGVFLAGDNSDSARRNARLSGDYTKAWGQRVQSRHGQGRRLHGRLPKHPGARAGPTQASCRGSTSSRGPAGHMVASVRARLTVGPIYGPQNTFNPNNEFSRGCGSADRIRGRGVVVWARWPSATATRLARREGGFLVVAPD